MQTTPIRGNPYPELHDPPDAPADFKRLAEALDDAPRARRGSLAGRPAASTYRGFYEITDGGRLRMTFSTGAVWIDVPRTWVAPLADRTPANDAGYGSEWIDTLGVIWKSNGSAWLYSGGSAPHVSVHRSTAHAVPPGGGEAIPWNAEGEDTWSMHAGEAAEVVLPYAGVWDFASQHYWASAGTAYTKSAYLMRVPSGGSQAILAYDVQSGDGQQVTHVAATRRCAAGDVIRVHVSHTSNSARSVMAPDSLQWGNGTWLTATLRSS